MEIHVSCTRSSGSRVPVAWHRGRLLLDQPLLNCLTQYCLQQCLLYFTVSHETLIIIYSDFIIFFFLFMFIVLFYDEAT